MPYHNLIPQECEEIEARHKRLVSQAVTAERERCATIAENTNTNDIGQIGKALTIQQTIAARIRNKE